MMNCWPGVRATAVLSMGRLRSCPMNDFWSVYCRSDHLLPP
jgi:hypothetical protein